MMTSKTCKTCGFRALKAPVCGIDGHEINAEQDFCSKHNSNPYTCDLCGGLVVQPIIHMENEVVHITCAKCAQAISTCVYCIKNNDCLFQTDPSPIPKMVEKQIRQGNMITVATIPNPERIEKTCKSKCECFDPENGCLRQFGYCGNHAFEWPGGQPNE